MACVTPVAVWQQNKHENVPIYCRGRKHNTACLGNGLQRAWVLRHDEKNPITKYGESTRPGRDLHSELRDSGPPAAAAPATCSLLSVELLQATAPTQWTIRYCPTRGDLHVDRWIDYLMPVEFSGFRPHRTTEPLTLSWSSSSERILTFRLLFPVPCWGFL